MNLCACGHDFTDHYQTDVEFLCLLCSWCDGYTKAAANISATAPVPAGGTPEGLAREKVEMTDSEVKPSSPTTEAGRVPSHLHMFTCAYCTGDGTDRPDFVDREDFEAHMGHLHHGLPFEFPSEQQARDEGRREAVRVLEQLVAYVERYVPATKHQISQPMMAARNYLDRVAGLNASESPPTDCLMPSACSVTGFYCTNWPHNEVER